MKINKIFTIVSMLYAFQGFTTFMPDLPVSCASNQTIILLDEKANFCQEVSINEISLSCKDKNIRHLKNIGTLTNLTHLFLNHNKLTSLEGVRMLTNLTHLFLNRNKLTSLEGIGTLTNLKDLNLGLNALTSLGDIGTLINLEDLNLNRNKLTSLGDIEKLTNLKYLRLGYNTLTSLEDIGTLTNLKYLRLSYNTFTSLEGIGTLTNLENLDFSYNTLTSLEGIGTLTNLKDLNLSGNALTSLGDIGKLINLKNLNLNHNALTFLGDIGNLINLECLSLSRNALTFLGDIQETLTSLRTVDFSNNKIVKFSFSDLSALFKKNENIVINIKGNFIDISQLDIRFGCNAPVDIPVLSQWGFNNPNRVSFISLDMKKFIHTAHDDKDLYRKSQYDSGLNLARLYYFKGVRLVPINATGTLFEGIEYFYMDEKGEFFLMREDTFTDYSLEQEEFMKRVKEAGYVKYSRRFKGVKGPRSFSQE